MAKNQAKANHFIIGFSRKDLAQRVNLQPGQLLTESQIQFELQRQIDSVIHEYESPAMGSNEILSLSVSTYPIADDIEYLVAILFRQPIL